MNKVIHKFNKSSIEEVRITRTTWNGKEYVDIRNYYETEDGEWKPTKKGVTVTLDSVNDLIAGIEKLKNEIKEL